MEVALAANGDLLLIDGRHRLILAQLLGLTKIPVVVDLVTESVAKSLLDCSDHSTARPYEESKRTTAAQWMSRHHLPLAVAKLLGLKNNACPLEHLNGVGATLSVADAESLKHSNCFIKRLNNVSMP